MRPTIGILGGVGPEASAKFYEQLIKRIQAEGVKSNTEYPHIILESVPAPELVNENSNLSAYKEAIINLERAGADFIVIVCNTAYIFLSRFASLVRIPIIDLNKEVENELKKRKINSIVVLGSQNTVNKLFKFSSIKHDKMSAEDSILIDKIILGYNRGEKEVEEQFIRIWKKYSRKDILIACTELSMIAKKRNLKCIDAFDILLDATENMWKTS